MPMPRGNTDKSAFQDAVRRRIESSRSSKQLPSGGPLGNMKAQAAMASGRSVTAPGLAGNPARMTKLKTRRKVVPPGLAARGGMPPGLAGRKGMPPGLTGRVASSKMTRTSPFQSAIQRRLRARQANSALKK